MSKDKSNDIIGTTYFVPKNFIWEKIYKEFDKQGCILKKESKSKKYNERYVAVYYNYVLWFKTGKGPNKSPHDKTEIPKGVIELERVYDEFSIQNDNEVAESFVITTKDSTFQFKLESIQQAQEWVKFLRNHLQRMRSLPPRESLEETNKKLIQCQQIFPETTFKPPMFVPPESAQKYVEEQRVYQVEYKKWLPFILSLGCYAEFQTGRMKGYIAWFNNKTKGVHESIRNSEDSVLENWKDLIVKAPENMEALTENMFYMDDIQKEVERYEKIYELIDIYNNVKKEFHLDNTEYFVDEKQLIPAWIERLKSYPYARDITMEQHTGGSVRSTDESFIYTRDDLTVRWISKNNETVEFSCKDHQFTFIDQIYGSVAWNNKSWLWTHPRCPFVIRYDYYPTKGVFKQKISKPKPINSKVPQREVPPLSDWQVTSDSIRAVTVGQRNPEPEIPPITSWAIEGDVPPAVALLAATFYKIRDTMQEILGLKFMVASGLNPIF